MNIIAGQSGQISQSADDRPRFDRSASASTLRRNPIARPEQGGARISPPQTGGHGNKISAPRQGFIDLRNDAVPIPNGNDRPGIIDLSDDAVPVPNSNDNTITGGSGNDIIRGGSGDDIIDGGQGDDILRGGKGNDFIAGGDGDDRIRGGKGSDVLTSGDGNDSIRGGKGNDTVVINGTGTKTVDGGQGDNTLVLQGTQEQWGSFFADDGTDDIVYRNDEGTQVRASNFENIIYAGNDAEGRG